MSAEKPFEEPLTLGEKWWVEHGHPLAEYVKSARTSQLVAMLAHPDELLVPHCDSTDDETVKSRLMLLLNLVAEELDRRVPVPPTP